MIINKVVLKNFKSHLNTSIEFNQGITLIIGENGAGKSTIMEAISFALFKKTAINIKDLIKKGENKLEVQLYFNANNKKYIVTRTNTKSQGTSKIEEILADNSHINIASGNKEVNITIESILAMDSELFLNAVYIQQGEIASLIDKRPSERKKLIGKLLGIDSLDKIWREFPVYINIYQFEKEKISGIVESNEYLSDNIKNKESEIADLEEDYNKINEELAKNTITFDELKIEIEKLDKDQLLFNQLESKLDSKNNLLKSVNSDIISFENQLKKIKENEILIKEYDEELKVLDLYKEFKDILDSNYNYINEIAKNLKDLENYKSYLAILNENQSSYDSYLFIKSVLEIIKDIENNSTPLENKLNALESKKELLDKNFKKNLATINEFIEKSNERFNEEFKNTEEIAKFLENENNQLSETLADIDNEILTSKNNISGLKQEIKSNRKPLKELKDVKNQCPICKSPIDENKKNSLKKSYEDIITNNNSKIKEINNSLSDLEENKKLISNKISELSKIKIDKYHDLYKELDEDKKDLEEIKNNITDLTVEIESLKENLFDLDLKSFLSYNDLENTKENILSLDISKLYNFKNKELKELEKDYNSYIKTKGSLDSIKSQDELNNIINDLKSKIHNNIKKLNELSNENLNEDFKLEYDEISSEIQRLEKIKDLYNQLLGTVKSKENIESNLKDKNDDKLKINEELEEITSTLKTFEYDKDHHLKLKLEHENLNKEISNLKIAIGKIEGSKTSLTQELIHLKEEEKKNELRKIELENLKSFINLLNDIRNEFSKDAIQKHLRMISKPLIQKSTLKIFEKFNFPYSDIILDEDYNLSLFSPNGEVTIDMISGGEKIAAALSLRLGITEAISKGNLEMVMLDEPTTHLDIHRRRDLIDILKEISITPQMIIVTHDSELEGVADNLIKIEKVDGSSKIVEKVN